MDKKTKSTGFSVLCFVLIFSCTAANPYNSGYFYYGWSTAKTTELAQSKSFAYSFVDNSQKYENSFMTISLASLACISLVVLLCLGVRNFFSKLCPDNSFKVFCPYKVLTLMAKDFIVL